MLGKHATLNLRGYTSAAVVPLQILCSLHMWYETYTHFSVNCRMQKGLTNLTDSNSSVKLWRLCYDEQLLKCRISLTTYLELKLVL